MSEDTGDTLRADVAAALDSTPADTPVSIPDTTGTPAPGLPADTPPPSTTPVDGRPRDEAGRFAPKPADSAAAPAAPKLPAQAPAAPAQPAGGAPAQPAAPTPGRLRPPGGWKPEAKAEWDKLSPQVQAEVVRRERESHHMMQSTSQVRQAFDTFKQVLAPFQANIAAYGGNAVEMIQTLARVDSTLRFGTTHEKATALATIIKESGVDIQALDNALAGLPASESTQQEQRFQQMLEERLGPVNEMISRISTARQSTQQTIAREARSELEDFAARVDIEPVREQMADLIEAAAARGQALTFEQAYEQAAWLHPDLRKAMIQREQAAAGQQAAAAAAKARAASVSVSGAPALSPPGGGGQDLSLRDTINAALDAHTQRV